jgi:SAM-dependent methyltransferase
MKKQYNFTENWFDDVAKPIWEQLFKEITKPKNILEIGCYEGKATTWLCDNVLGDGTSYDVIDTFQGSLDESGMISTKNLLLNNESYIETNFKHNISFHPNIKFTIYKGYSQLILPTLPLEETYDFIYIDASHRADDTFVDAYYANKMLKSGGILIFDDFGWKDPKNMHPANSPQLGVEIFNTMYSDYYSVIFHGYQVRFVKK